MKERLDNNQIIELTDNERDIINRVISQYNIKARNCIKMRNYYKIETDNGVVCLSRIRKGRRNVKNGSILADELIKNDFEHITKYIRTKNGELFIKYKKYYFYAFEWIDGEKININDINDVAMSAKLLAEFHIAASKIDMHKLKLKSNLKNWPLIFNNNLSELDKFKRIIERKKVRNEFDIAYENVIDDFHYRGMLALNLLNNSDYYEMSREASHNITICHDDFYCHSITRKNDEYYITNLNKIIIDLQINDLGKYIRHIMFKRGYKWDFNKAKEIIESYNSVRKLTKSEVEVMLALIVFPQKYWKLGNRRYIKHKKWSEVKYMHKLNKLIKYNEYQQKFLDEYLNFLLNYE